MPHQPSASVVLLASVLKPLDDTRMYEKLGRTLAGRAGWQVHVAGRHAPAPTPSLPNLHTHSLFAGPRLSWRRLGAQRRYWQLLQTLRPHWLVVHAPELLPLTMLWLRLHPGCRLLYDVRENYALNITTQHVYPPVVRRVLAAGLRWVETLAARRAQALLLAEHSYAEELPFLRELPANRVLVLENKYQPALGEEITATSPPLLQPTAPLRLLFSGTLSVLNGVQEAVALAQALRTRWPQLQLTIIGASQQPAVVEYLTRLAQAGHAWLRIVGGRQLVPHHQIQAEIGRSHLGLLPYRPHPSTWRCRPTKLFEYQAHALPVLIPANPLWGAAVQAAGAGLVVDFEDLSAAALDHLTRQLSTTRFYPAGPPASAYWAGEAEKLNHLLDSIG